MSDQTLSATTDVGVTGRAAIDGVPAAGSPDAARALEKKRKKDDRPLEERKVHEAGGVIVCDGKVVLRLTDKQRWIFPKGKLKKRESARDAAIREATEETGLKVEVIDQVADLLIRHEGKKRRFIFFLMRATAKTWDWPHHEGRDTYLVSPERIPGLLRHKAYASIWEATQERVRAMVDERTPFVTHPSGESGTGPAIADPHREPERAGSGDESHDEGPTR
jgi:8-oxo-dGTP pyrophosphatase MutT (NUDIX family)